MHVYPEVRAWLPTYPMGKCCSEYLVFDCYRDESLAMSHSLVILAMRESFLTTSNIFEIEFIDIV
jgi:hypothetical protein